MNLWTHNAGTMKARKETEQRGAFGIEDESAVREELKKHERRVIEDGYTIVQIAETAKENHLFDTKSEYESNGMAERVRKCERRDRIFDERGDRAQPDVVAGVR